MTKFFVTIDRDDIYDYEIWNIDEFEIIYRLKHRKGKKFDTLSYIKYDDTFMNEHEKIEFDIMTNRNIEGKIYEYEDNDWILVDTFYGHKYDEGCKKLFCNLYQLRTNQYLSCFS